MEIFLSELEGYQYLHPPYISRVQFSLSQNIWYDFHIDLVRESLPLVTSKNYIAEDNNTPLYWAA